jgi:hypothetical protein
MYFNDRFGFDAESMKHLAEVLPRPIVELEQLDATMAQLAEEVGRRAEEVKEHMMHCGPCLSKQIADGTLITLEEYWAATHLPKFHLMMN